LPVVHDAPGTRDREVQLNVPGGVPAERADPRVGAQVERVQGGDDLARAGRQFASVVRSRPGRGTRHDGLRPEVLLTRARIELMVSGASCISPYMPESCP